MTDKPQTIKVFSYGGGVQSTAALVLASQGRIDYKTFIFCNVGDDSENPGTLSYYRDHALPYAKSHGLELIELQRHMRDGSVETIAGRINRLQRSVPIPARMSNGAPGNRACTLDFKVRVVAKWIKEHGATKANPGIVGLGISMDEFQRMRTDSGIAWERLEYPLIDLRLNRAACMKIIQEAGLPVPPKSSCFFCPYHSQAEWMRIKREEPDLFAKAIEIEKKINKTREIGKDYVYLHSKLIPLDQIEGIQTAFSFDEMGVCESGYCMI